jgi:hypothetical protein
VRKAATADPRRIRQRFSLGPGSTLKEWRSQRRGSTPARSRGVSPRGRQGWASTFVLATAMCGCASHRVRAFRAALEGANAVKVPALVCIATGEGKASFR